jgi:hypothetical protein
MNQQSLAQIEQQQLVGLEERYQWTKSQIEGNMSANRPATLEEIRHAAAYTQQLVEWFGTNYGPTASSLQSAGFSKLAHRLNTIIADLQQAHTMFVSMEQEKIQPPTVPSSTQGKTPEEFMKGLRDSSRQQDQTRRRMVGDCIYCGGFLEGRSLCPHCGRYQEG